MSEFLFEGTYTALVTPMKGDAERSVDIAALERLVTQQIDGGVDGLVPCGTTGEAATLSLDEWKTVVSTVIRVANGRVPVIAGTGSNNTAQTIATTQAAKALGVDGALVVVPYYNKPTQAGLIAHFEAVLAAVNVPVVLYNVPGRTVTNMAAETTAHLAAHPQVAAIKEASGNLDQVQRIIELTEGRFAVLSGDDGLCVPMYSVGGRGVVSVVSNCAPSLTAALYNDFRAGRCVQAGQGQIALRTLIEALFSEANPQPIKAAMAALGLMEAHVRLPLLTASAEAAHKVTDAMGKLGLLPA
ncbi:MAG: 4-hydroxy-tetrahydrodipicolinate synthase [Myxococcales bacterium]|nr:4-hydroxy-tetrahydrodipicolinate synthase [Myxococcales bacterium]